MLHNILSNMKVDRFIFKSQVLQVFHSESFMETAPPFFYLGNIAKGCNSYTLFFIFQLALLLSAGDDSWIVRDLQSGKKLFQTKEQSAFPRNGFAFSAQIEVTVPIILALEYRGRVTAKQ